MMIRDFEDASIYLGEIGKRMICEAQSVQVRPMLSIIATQRVSSVEIICEKPSLLNV